MLSNEEFLLWCKRLSLSPAAQEAIATIRSGGPPRASHAEQFGFYYRLRSSAEIDWTLQRNLQYLEDYWRFEADVAPAIRERIRAEIAAAPGLLLSNLFRKIEDTASRDDVHRLIARGDVFVDFRYAGLMETEKVRVFPNRETAVAYARVQDACGGARFVRFTAGASIMWDGRVSTIVNSGEKTVALLGEDRVL